MRTATVGVSFWLKTRRPKRSQAAGVVVSGLMATWPAAGVADRISAVTNNESGLCMPQNNEAYCRERLGQCAGAAKDRVPHGSGQFPGVGVLPAGMIRGQQHPPVGERCFRPVAERGAG